MTAVQDICRLAPGVIADRRAGYALVDLDEWDQLVHPNEFFDEDAIRDAVAYIWSRQIGSAWPLRGVIFAEANWGGVSNGR
jgi:hypothetical protein